jgi:hypothetical protein
MLLLKVIFHGVPACARLQTKKKMMEGQLLTKRMEELTRFYVTKKLKPHDEAMSHAEMILSRYRFVDIITSLVKKYGAIPVEWEQLPLQNQPVDIRGNPLPQKQDEGPNTALQYGCRPYLQFFKGGKFLYNSTWATRFGSSEGLGTAAAQQRVRTGQPPFSTRSMSVRTLNPQQKARLKQALLTFCLSTGNKGAFWGAGRRGVGPGAGVDAGDEAPGDPGVGGGTGSLMAETDVGVEAELESRIERVLKTSNLTPRELQALLRKKYGKAPDLVQALGRTGNTPGSSQVEGQRKKARGGMSGGVQWVDRNSGGVSFTVNHVFQGDIVMRCRHVTRPKGSKEAKADSVTIFSTAFHTGYLPPPPGCDGIDDAEIPIRLLRLGKKQLDGACNDVRFDDSFYVEMVFAPLAVAEAGLGIGDETNVGLAGAGGGNDATSQISISVADAPAYLTMVEREKRSWDNALTRRRVQRESVDPRAANGDKGGSGGGGAGGGIRIGLGLENCRPEPIFAIGDSCDSGDFDLVGLGENLHGLDELGEGLVEMGMEIGSPRMDDSMVDLLDFNPDRWAIEDAHRKVSSGAGAGAQGVGVGTSADTEGGELERFEALEAELGLDSGDAGSGDAGSGDATNSSDRLGDSSPKKQFVPEGVVQGKSRIAQNYLEAAAQNKAKRKGTSTGAAAVVGSAASEGAGAVPPAPPAPPPPLDVQVQDVPASQTAAELEAEMDALLNDSLDMSGDELFSEDEEGMGSGLLEFDEYEDGQSGPAVSAVDDSSTGIDLDEIDLLGEVDLILGEAANLL